MWSDFEVAMAGVTAVLAGLVFVALSVNLERLLRVDGLIGRAADPVIVLVGAALQCGILLMPTPEHHPTVPGWILLVVGVAESALLLVLALRGSRARTKQPASWHLTRIVAGQLCALPVVVAGILWIALSTVDPLWWFAFAVLFSVVAGTANAWVLTVEVVRDERYAPAE